MTDLLDSDQEYFVKLFRVLEDGTHTYLGWLGMSGHDSVYALVIPGGDPKGAPVGAASVRWVWPEIDSATADESELDQHVSAKPTPGYLCSGKRVLGGKGTNGSYLYWWDGDLVDYGYPMVAGPTANGSPLFTLHRVSTIDPPGSTVHTSDDTYISYTKDGAQVQMLFRFVRR